MSDGESVFARWSRRKLEAKAEAAGVAPREPVSEQPAPQAPAAPAAAPVPQELEGGVTPEYREFFDPRVEETLRRSALRKLFSDPQFNVMDGLDTYIDDYSKPDPIPEAMLRRLNQAKELSLFDEEDKASGETSAAAGDAPDNAPPTIAVADATTSAQPLSLAPDSATATGPEDALPQEVRADGGSRPPVGSHDAPTPEGADPASASRRLTRGK